MSFLTIFIIHAIEFTFFKCKHLSLKNLKLQSFKLTLTKLYKSDLLQPKCQLYFYL